MGKKKIDGAVTQKASIDTSTGRIRKEVVIKPADERGHTQIAPAERWGSSSTGVWDPPTQRGK